jgi:dihydropteroate synthase
MLAMTQILGIVNVTRDSFSDGGKYLHPDAAVAHARRLAADGADIIELGAESTHPDAEDVPAEVEIARLTPVIEPLKADGIRVSVDTHKPAVMRHALALGADFINDVTALRNPQSVAVVRDVEAKLIIMHSRSSAARAERAEIDPTGIVEEIRHFFERRIGELAEAGISRNRLILDPGMGFFLSSNARASLAVLHGLRRLTNLGCPLLVSTSRKSFIGAVLGCAEPRPVGARLSGTLASEIWAVLKAIRGAGS